MSESSKAVFLSYASQDSVAAHRLAAALRAGGIEVWLDTAELRGGDVWDQTIQRRIKDCALFIPIISHTTDARHEGYFRLEWKLAVERLRLLSERVAFLLPVVIDDTADRDADVPEAFRHVQWTRLPQGEAAALFVERVQGLLRLTGVHVHPTHPPGTPAPPAPLTPSSLASTARNMRSPLLIGLIAALVATSAIIGWQHFKSTTPAAPAVTVATSTLTIATTPPVTVNDEKSVAVLPFVNESSDKEQEYFADGLTDTMIDLLSKVPDLRVPARSSSFFFKGKNEELSTIAAKLHVTHVLEGTVRRSGNRLRVSAELVRADTGYHAWSETYDRDGKDIFKVQDEISAAVVAALKLKLVAAGTNTRVRGTANPEAYNQFLIGKHYQVGLVSADTYRRAGEALRKAVALDPAYADASALLVLADAFLADLTGDAAGRQRAIAAAERLPLLQPDHGPSYRMRAVIRENWQWDWAGAQADYEQALALDPADAAAYYDEALLLQTLGRFREALAPVQKALAFDGLNLGYLSNLASAQMAMRDYLAAQQTVQRMAQIDPRSEQTAGRLSTVRLLQGHYAESLAECPKITDERTRLLCVAQAEHSLGHRAQAQQTLSDLLKTGTGGNLTNLASVYAWFGDADQAFAWFDKAIAARESGVLQILVDRRLDGLHKDPRWKVLLKKMNLPS